MIDSIINEIGIELVITLEFIFQTRSRKYCQLFTLNDSLYKFQNSYQRECQLINTFMDKIVCLNRNSSKK